ncbi:hypothetical protein M408DRAFT_7862 [Serendipita vermifera MAFF 305830]|uniref:Uncharacterized protein n=1 Tax=Serendipita vermifera MAFF 305830 TaxID=933852 RepID=A0A0C3BCT4_SERVB|nr:hypothetical protein M408DRAFT_7862 [Serendipita vermifera MAFF 305830]
MASMYQGSRPLPRKKVANYTATHLAIIAVGVCAVIGETDRRGFEPSLAETLQIIAQGNLCGLDTPRLLGATLLLLTPLMFAYQLPLEILIISLQFKHCFDRRYLVHDTCAATLPLLYVFSRDGLVYFVLAFVMRLATGTLVATRIVWPFYTFTFLEFSLTSIVICRLFIHLRMVVRQQQEGNEVSTQERATLTGMFRSSIGPDDPFRRQSENEHSHHIPLTSRTKPANT